MNTATEWREFASKPGAISTVMHFDWLQAGCPKCDCKTWQVTSDGWAYCDGCRKGYSTAYPFTMMGKTLSHVSEDGRLHCFMCEGLGERDGEPCDECDGTNTQNEPPYIRPSENTWELVDDTGVVFSGTEEEIWRTFREIQSDTYEGGFDWNGDLKLVEVHEVYNG